MSTGDSAISFEEFLQPEPEKEEVKQDIDEQKIEEFDNSGDEESELDVQKAVVESLAAEKVERDYHNNKSFIGYTFKSITFVGE